MQAAPLAPELRSAAPALAGRLREICVGLATLIARAFLRNPARVALIVPLWSRLRRNAGRFDRLLARIVQGTDQPRPSRPRAAAATAAPPRPGVAFPAAHGWLLKDLRHEAAVYANRLDRLLSEPEAAALIAHCPSMLRLLRPLCHMLGVRHAGVPTLPRRRKSPAPGAAEDRRGSAGPAETAAASRLPPPLRNRPPTAHSRPEADLCPHFLRWPWVPLDPVPTG